MALSFETKELLGDFLIFGGIGIGSVMSMILLVVLYFRVTRKYDAMFPSHADLTDARGIQGEINRTGRYMWCFVRKNFSQRNERIRKVTGGYDFRSNAPLSEVILCYLMLFSGFVLIGSTFVFIILTKILGIEL